MWGISLHVTEAFMHDLVGDRILVRYVILSAPGTSLCGVWLYDKSFKKKNDGADTKDKGT